MGGQLKLTHEFFACRKIFHLFFSQLFVFTLLILVNTKQLNDNGNLLPGNFGSCLGLLSKHSNSRVFYPTAPLQLLATLIMVLCLTFSVCVLIQHVLSDERVVAMACNIAESKEDGDNNDDRKDSSKDETCSASPGIIVSVLILTIIPVYMFIQCMILKICLSPTRRNQNSHDQEFVKSLKQLGLLLIHCYLWYVPTVYEELYKELLSRFHAVVLCIIIQKRISLSVNRHKLSFLERDHYTLTSQERYFSI